MLESIKNYLNRCPLTADIKNEFSGHENCSCSLHGDQYEVLSSYIDGSRLMKFKFKICVRQKFSSENCDESIKHCNSIAAWIRNEAGSGRLPDCGDRIFAQYIEIENDPIVLKNEVASAVYALDCYLVYYEKRR